MNRSAVAGALVVALAAPVSISAGQNETPSQEEVLRELRRLRERVDKLERQHEEDQERIRRLEGRADEPPPEPAERPPTPELPPAEIQPDATDLTLALPPESAVGQGNLFNPQITAFFDLGFSLSTDDDDARFNRFNLRETELDLRAAVTPWADGVLVLAFGEEFSEDADGDSEVDIEFELEEAYLNAHTLPWDLALKGGKFRNAFGINNVLHTHDLPQVDRPLAVQAFLGQHGLSTTGGSLSWLVPNPFDRYVELTGEIFNADGGHESPILDGADADNPAFLAHLKYNDDVGVYGWFEVGGSYLYARVSDDHDFDANIFGLDATLMLPDANAPDMRSLLIQSEFFWADNDIEDSPYGSFRNDSFGFYAFAQYQFDLNWYAGVRFDYTEFPSVEVRARSDEDWAVSPYVTWYVTEFLRLRAQYQHLESKESGSWSDDENFFFAVTFSIGAHPAHPYWVNR
ncbi:MAG: hypothetical protein ACYTGY_16340 [Planctomycetota bacterium]|jgi:hypothetical protein